MTFHHVIVASRDSDSGGGRPSEAICKWLGVSIASSDWSVKIIRNLPHIGTNLDLTIGHVVEASGDSNGVTTQQNYLQVVPGQ